MHVATDEEQIALKITRVCIGEVLQKSRYRISRLGFVANLAALLGISH